MKIVVIGGTGLIGKRLVENLSRKGHKVIAASPSKGVNAVTGEGLAAALEGSQVVVDVSNAPSWEDQAVLDFFQTSTRNLLAAEATAGVQHHVALSVVGTERMLASGYFRAKMAQEKLIEASPVPYTIVRATQFFEFLPAVVDAASDGQTVRLPSSRLQPMLAADVSDALAEIAEAEPARGMLEIAGPEAIPLDELARQLLRAKSDPRTVTTDPHATYYGTPITDCSLIPGASPRLGPTRYSDWLARTFAGNKEAVGSARE